MLPLIFLVVIQKSATLALQACLLTAAQQYSRQLEAAKNFAYDEKSGYLYDPETQWLVTLRYTWSLDPRFFSFSLACF